MPKVLVIAFAMEPNRGGEPGIGWNFTADLARTQPVWAITHPNHKAAIEAHLAQHPTRYPIHITYCDLPAPFNKLEGLTYATFNIYYYFWQRAAAKIARRLHDEVGFDIAQHVSLVRWWMPSAAESLVKHGVKFVWGPLGGGEGLARKFWPGIGLKNRLVEISRRIARTLWMLDPALGRNARNCSVALSYSEQTTARLKRLGVKSVQTMSISAVSLSRNQYPPRENTKFRIISGGGLVYWKRFDLSLRAFAKANLPNAEYVHVCGGVEQPKLEALARELGIADRVKFAGELNYRQCVAEVVKADMIVQPVLRDSAGLVAEALALGVPALTFDLFSAGFFVTPESGHKIKMTQETQLDDLVDGMARTMKAWHDDPALLERMKAGALARGQQLSAANRGKLVRDLHHSLLTEPEMNSHSAQFPWSLPA